MNRMSLAAFAAICLPITSPASANELEGKLSPTEVLAASEPSDWRALDPESLLYIELERGRVTVALSERLAQGHVGQIKALAREGFYDGLSFYRVIDGFVAQGGDVFEKREIKTAEKAVEAEFEEPFKEGNNFAAIKDVDGYAPVVGFVDGMPAGVDRDENSIWLLHCAGAMAMARGNEKDTGGTEFYITLQPQRYLDRNLTVFGRVISGMEHLQALRRVSPPQSEEDDLGEIITSIRVAADMPDEAQEELEILRTETKTFQDYVEARRNRPEAFFYVRPDHADVCAINIPVRTAGEE